LTTSNAARITGPFGKDTHVRTLPMPDWVKDTLDDWLRSAEIRHGKLFRCVCRNGAVWVRGHRKSRLASCEGVRGGLGITKLAPHDLRRSCARFCHDSGGELEQIQFLLGHVSVQTTEKYLGCKQRFRAAVNDRIGIEPTTCQQKSLLRV
jgi:integrase